MRTFNDFRSSGVTETTEKLNWQVKGINHLQLTPQHRAHSLNNITAWRPVAKQLTEQRYTKTLNNIRPWRCAVTWQPKITFRLILKRPSSTYHFIHHMILVTWHILQHQRELLMLIMTMLVDPSGLRVSLMQMWIITKINSTIATSVTVVVTASLTYFTASTVWRTYRFMVNPQRDGCTKNHCGYHRTNPCPLQKGSQQQLPTRSSRKQSKLNLDWIQLLRKF